jgi:hypothetical protein
VALVKHLPESDLRVARDINILRTVAYELKKTATHIVVSCSKKVFWGATTSELLTQVAAAAECFVDIGSSHNHLLIMGSPTAVRKHAGRPIRTAPTKGSDALHPIGKWNTLQEFPKGSAIGVSIQAYQEETSVIVFDHLFRKVYQSGKEVGFIDDDDLIAFQTNFIQILYPNTRDSPLVVRDHVVFVTVTDVTRMFDNQHTHSQTSIAGNNTQNAGGFSREHGTNDDIKRHYV